MANPDPCQSQRDAVTSAQQDVNESRDPQLARGFAQALATAQLELNRCIAAHRPPPPSRLEDIYIAESSFRIEIQLPGGSGTVPATVATLIAVAIRQKIQMSVPNSNPVVVVIDTAYENRAPDGRHSTWFGVWLNGGLPSPEAISQGQVRIYAPDTSLLSGESVAVSINVGMIIAGAQQRWQQMPKWYDSNFRQNPQGNIQLKSFSINAAPPAVITMHVTGTDDDPIPDVDFTVDVQETISVVNGRVISTIAGRVNADISWLNYVTGALLNPWSFFGLGALGVIGGPGLALTGLGALLGGSLIASEFGLIPTGSVLPAGATGQFNFNVSDYFWNRFTYQGTTIVANYSRVGIAGGGSTYGSLTAGGALVPISALQTGSRPIIVGPDPSIR